jgi:hypothetical protein
MGNPFRRVGHTAASGIRGPEIARIAACNTEIMLLHKHLAELPSREVSPARLVNNR